MASVTGSALSMSSLSCSFKQSKVPSQISSLNSVSLPINGKFFPSIRLQTVAHRFKVSCAAKPETVEKVCEIVRKQLALPAETSVTGDSTFATLGADSLDTVEIVMGLEEEFGISVEEDSAQSIGTVQEAADLIEQLMEKKGA
ncbi:acyl carrier protein 1, chloroplastic-like isoform X1 [Diospyros lotus]|uniref:acyl carrier protein 1, chloroplastic-like isoform X1 n=1 Tax=Diospyros lotus TaxID=55363 RepID=UPI0022592A71|nr:acyl carrier protein 1, chloroplastic-like isoform X1 [Diospyros lotus]